MRLPIEVWLNITKKIMEYSSTAQLFSKNQDLPSSKLKQSSDCFSESPHSAGLFNLRTILFLDSKRILITSGEVKLLA